MKNISDVNYCCGCSACIFKCPKKCISIKEDENGFYVAHCNNDLCINCGICLKICPIIEKRYCNKKTNDVYIAVSKNNEFYNKSSSGGIFSTLSEYILKKNGVVFGCGVDDNLVPKHMVVKNINELESIRRSKYVQSYMDNSYLKVKAFLNKNKRVLFAGTPCQISGLKNYLNKEYDNLFTIDLICHGVPSKKMFLNNIKYMENKLNIKIKSYEFRLKYGDNKYYKAIYKDINDNMIVKTYYKDPYYSAFYDCCSLNEICYSCPYANEDRVGDITIGDFEWGKRYHSLFNNYMDVSCVLVNNKKGKLLFKEIENELICEKTKWEYILEKNLNLIRPTRKPEYRNYIYKEIRQKGYNKWANRYFYSSRYWKKTFIMKPLRNLKALLNKVRENLK